MPKWWPISWITVRRTCSTTSDSDCADPADGLAVDRDPVGQYAGVVRGALRQRDALVQPEQARVDRDRAPR